MGCSIDVAYVAVAVAAVHHATQKCQTSAEADTPAVRDVSLFTCSLYKTIPIRFHGAVRVCDS